MMMTDTRKTGNMKDNYVHLSEKYGLPEVFGDQIKLATYNETNEVQSYKLPLANLIELRSVYHG